MSSTGLLEKRLLIVTGKGGAGKSTVAAALALRATRRGRRTIVAEIGDRGDVQRMFGARTRQTGEHELLRGLFTVAIDPRRALEEYLADQLPTRGLAELLGASRTFGYLTAATPGLRELLCIGKAWELAQPQRRVAGRRSYDLVILDAPASGHAIALLAAARTFARAAQVGPIASQGARIHATLVDPRLTRVVAVARAQEAAVNETLETRRRLAAELGIGRTAVLVNALRPRRFAARDIGALRAAVTQDAPAGTRHALELALAEDRRVRSERAQLRRLRRALDGPSTELPFVYAPEIGVPQLELLGDHLEPAL